LLNTPKASSSKGLFLHGARGRRRGKDYPEASTVGGERILTKKE